jgi:D-sedoheptulose 7-phosphate isomerase
MDSIVRSEVIGEKLLLNLRLSIEAKNSLVTNLSIVKEYAKAVDVIIKCYEEGGRLYIAGNGGSAADAQHLAAEFVSKFSRPRGPLPSEALTVDSSVVTAIANDYGYEKIFSRQLEAKATSKDVFLGLSTSGSSPNIIEALKVCKAMNIKSIVFTGYKGGNSKELADYCIMVPGKSTALIQELHVVLYHTLCETVETYMFFNEP